ncbi:MAG: caspase family protein [Pseudomonadota bacterium]
MSIPSLVVPAVGAGRLFLRRSAALVFVLASALVVAVPAAARDEPTAIDYRQAPKFALVVGNQRYDDGFALPNAERDARLIAARLRAAGYATVLVLNADRATLYAEIGKLATQLKDGGVGAFYYAGHGLQIKGRNYLIPSDAPMRRAAALAPAALPVDYLIERFKDSGAHLSIVLLDACRNEAAAEPGRPVYRGFDATGFVAARPANGMLVAYATQPGERALDGSGDNGPFALALSSWLARPGLPLEQAMKHVMTEVRAATRDEQRPWVASSMVGDFALVPAAGQRAMLYRPRGAKLAGASRGAPSPQADGGMLQWFQNQSVADQMLLVAQIRREAKAINRDDLPGLMRRARGGSVVAQAVLGAAHRDGFGVGRQATRSNVAALAWYRMAAAQKMPFALNELGEMYFLGHGVARDDGQARAYFEAGAAHGFPPAKLNLLQMGAESGKLAPTQLLDMLLSPK